MIRRYRSPSIPSSSPPSSSSSSSSSSTSSSIILIPAPPSPITDFGCTSCRLLFTDLDAAQDHMLTDPRHARLNSTISDRDNTAIMHHLTSQISVHARLSPAESSAVKQTALNEQHIAEVRAARKVLEASGANRTIRDMLKTPGPRAPAARKKMKFSHNTYLTNIIVQPPVRVAPDVIVAVKLVSEKLPQPVHLRVVIPAGTITYDGVLAAVAKAYEATGLKAAVVVRELASRGWVVDYRPLNGQGVLARIRGGGDVQRMMEAGPEWVRRMIIG